MNVIDKQSCLNGFEGTLLCSTIQSTVTVTCSTPDGTTASLSSIHHTVVELTVSQHHSVRRTLIHLVDVSVKEANTSHIRVFNLICLTSLSDVILFTVSGFNLCLYVS